MWACHDDHKLIGHWFRGDEQLHQQGPFISLCANNETVHLNFCRFYCFKQYRNEHVAVNPQRDFSVTFLVWMWLQRLTLITFQNVNIYLQVSRCFSWKNNKTALVLKGRGMQRFESHQRLRELKISPSREGRDQKRRHANWKWFAYQTVLSAIHKVKEVIHFVLYSWRAAVDTVNLVIIGYTINLRL